MLLSTPGDTLALARVLVGVAYAQLTFRKYKNETLSSISYSKCQTRFPNPRRDNYSP
jgi:hypothetical protein